MRRLLATAVLTLACAGPGHAQLFRRAPVVNSPPVASPPAKLPPAEADIWPFPPPDPKSWWTDKWPRPPEAADPLGGRRTVRGERLPVIDNGIDASTYRMWGLTPLQWQVLYPGEMIVEVWMRPSTSVRQAVARVTVRRDGQAFVQGRAGFACCEAGVGRLMGFDAQAPPGSAQAFLALRDLPLWRTPRMVVVSEAGAVEGLCVNGVNYDLTLVVPGRSRSLHRACEDAEIGQAAEVLEPVLKAALGHDARFDVLFPGGASFAAEREAYQALLAHGGALKPDPQGRAQPPGSEAAPGPEPARPAAPGRSSPGG